MALCHSPSTSRPSGAVGAAGAVLNTSTALQADVPTALQARSRTAYSVSGSRPRTAQGTGGKGCFVHRASAPDRRAQPSVQPSCRNLYVAWQHSCAIQ